MLVSTSFGTVALNRWGVRQGTECRNDILAFYLNFGRGVQEGMFSPETDSGALLDRLVRRSTHSPLPEVLPDADARALARAMWELNRMTEWGKDLALSLEAIRIQGLLETQGA